MKKIVNILITAVAFALIATPAFAEEAAASTGAVALGPLAAGLAIGLAALGGALGQGRAIGSALDSIGRNPASSEKLQTPMLIGLAFIESLVIFAFVVALRQG